MPRYWSPHDIEVLLFHYYSVEEWPRGFTNAYRDSIQKLVEHDLIVLEPIDPNRLYKGDSARTTERGCALIEALCRTPPPEPQSRWVDPRTGEGLYP